MGAPALSSTVRLRLILATLALLLAWALVEAGPPRTALTPIGGTHFSTLGSIGVSDELVPFLGNQIDAGLMSALGQSVGADGIAGVGSSVLGSPTPQPVAVSGLTGAVSVAPSSPDGSGAQGQSISFPSDPVPSALEAVGAESDAGAPGDEDEGSDGDDAAAPPAAGGTQSAGSSGEDGGEGSSGDDGDDEDEDEDEDEDDEDDEDDDD